MPYESLEAIEKDFGKRIKDTDSDDEKRELGIEKREAIAEFRETHAAARELEAHRAAAIATSGLPEQAHKFVRGNTIEEIDASVKEQVEYVAMLTSAANDAAAKAGYGSAGAAGGAAPGAQVDPSIEKDQDFERRFNESTRGSAIRTGDGGKVSVQEAQAYVGRLGAAHIVDHLARTSSKPSVRAAMQNVDLQTLKPKG